MNETTERLHHFASVLLERHGALVDWPEPAGEEPPEGMAVLPKPLARELNCSESVRLTHEVDAETLGRADVLSVNLAADFLERAEPLIRGTAQETCLRIEQLYLKKSAMDDPVARFFHWPNARVRVRAALADRIAYHGWYFLAGLASEDRWEELVRFTTNSATGAVIDLPDALTHSEARQTAGGEAFAAAPDLASARRLAAGLAQQKAAAFVERLENRLERDRKRLSDYYMALLEENSPARQRVSADPQALADKRRAVEVELRRKLLELDERYAIQTHLELLGLVRLSMPALRVECEVDRRHTRGVCHVYWNPLLKELEPLACRHCGRNITRVYFDEQLRPLCENCMVTQPKER